MPVTSLPGSFSARRAVSSPVPPEIDDAQAAADVDQREEIVEGREALRLELEVLRGIPWHERSLASGLRAQKR